MKRLGVVVVLSAALAAVSLQASDPQSDPTLCCHNPGCGGCECRNISHLVHNNVKGNHSHGAQRWTSSEPWYSSISRNQSETNLVSCLLCKVFKCKINIRNATSERQ